MWVGTRSGAYRHHGEDQQLVTPETMMIEQIEEVGGRIWVRSTEGAYVLEAERLVRITEPFLQIRAIKEVASKVWILTKTEVMFDSDGPAHRVHGYFASPVPSAVAKVSNVLEAGGFAWIAEPDRLHRVGTDELRTIPAISPNVDDMVQVGRTLWLTTHARGLMAQRGHTYRMAMSRLPMPIWQTSAMMLTAARITIA